MSLNLSSMKEVQKYVKEFAARNRKNHRDVIGWEDNPTIDTFDHLHEELLEMSRHLRYKTQKERNQIIKDKKEEFVDGVGDLFFALCRLANQLNVDTEDAFNLVKGSIVERYK